MLKKYIAIGILLCLIIHITACSPSNENQNSNIESSSDLSDASSIVSEDTVSTPVPESESEPISEPEVDELYDLFTVPEMTDEQQQYYDNYIIPLIYNGMLMVDWSNENYSNISTAPSGASQSNNLIMAFEDIIGQDEMQKIWQEHGTSIPADIIETVLLKRFAFTAQQLHEIMYSCYDAANNKYNYEGGRGGGPIEGAVVDVRAEGDELYLSYELFTGFSGLDEEPATYFYKIPGVLMLKKSDNDFRYYSVDADENVEAQAKRDIALRDK